MILFHLREEFKNAYNLKLPGNCRHLAIFFLNLREKEVVMSNNTSENLMDYFLDLLLVQREEKKNQLVCESKDKVQAVFFFFFPGHFCASYFGVNFLAGWIKESQDKVGKMSGK